MKAKQKRQPRETSGVKATCHVGPYQGYFGLAEYDVDDGFYSGELLGINDVVTFVGKTPEEVAGAFRDSVDDYVAFCARHKQTPDKPFSGKLMLRLPTDLHRQVSMLAEARSVSLNTLLTDMLRGGVEQMLGTRD